MQLPSPLSFGDTIYCRVRGNTLVVLAYDKWDAEIPFKLVGYDPVLEIYILLCPKYYDIKGSWKIKEESLSLGLKKEHIGMKAVSITNKKIARVETVNTQEDGMVCNKCNKFIYMAGPNQEDGAFICYSCRDNPYR